MILILFSLISILKIFQVLSFTLYLTYLAYNRSTFSMFCKIRWRERRPFVISASGSLDLVDLHGVGRPDWFQKGPAKAAVAPATTQFHWQDPSLSTESSRGEKPPACFSVPGVDSLRAHQKKMPLLPFMDIKDKQGRQYFFIHRTKRKKKLNNGHYLYRAWAK